MSYFKRFTDFCAAFAAFVGIIYIFGRFMSYGFKEDIEGTVEKLKFFFSVEGSVDYMPYIMLIGFFIISFAFSCIFHRLPYLTLCVSALPLMYTVTMIAHNKLYDRPALFVFLGVAHMCGCLFECIHLDRADRGRRAAIACDLLSLMAVVFCLYVFYMDKNIDNIEFKEQSFFQHCFYSLRERVDTVLFKRAAICFTILPLIRLLHRDVYFIDAALSLIPCAYFIYLWNTDKIPLFGEVLAVASVALLLGRLSIMLLCSPKRAAKKEAK